MKKNTAGYYQTQVLNHSKEKTSGHYWRSDKTRQKISLTSLPEYKLSTKASAAIVKKVSQHLRPLQSPQEISIPDSN